MHRIWAACLVAAAGLIVTGGCASTSRPMVFHRNQPETEVCPPAVMPSCGGPLLGDMPAMGPAPVVTPGMIPPGTVTIPGPGGGVLPGTVAPANPPVGPQPRQVPATGTPTAKPTT
jgi:hypothetical protein